MLVLPPRPPKGVPLAQQLAGGAASGLITVGSQLAQRKQMEQAAKQENETLKRLGIDAEGLSPEMKKVVLAETLKGQSKENLLGQKQGFLDRLFGGKQQPPGMISEEPLARMEEGSEMGGFDPSSIPDEAIARASSIDPNLARTLMHAKDVSLREKRAEKQMQERRHLISRKEEGEISKPVLLELNQARKNIPLQEQAIEDIQNAAPEVSSLDYLADVTGFEPLRTASGAKMKTAIKDFFLSDLTRAGSRPNQWIEQQLADALPKIGRSPEANLIVAEGMKFKVDLAKKRIELMDELVEKDREKYGFVRGDIDSRAYKLMKPYVEERKRDLKESIKKVKSGEKKQDNQFIRMKSPDGEMWEIPAGDVDEAEENGFTFG